MSRDQRNSGVRNETATKVCGAIENIRTPIARSCGYTGCIKESS